MRVRVYWNLHRKCYSVMDASTGRVIQHANAVMLRDVRYTVQPAGYARTIREGRKCVHAFIDGHIINNQLIDFKSARPVTYNPQRGPHWYDKATGEVLTTASAVRATTSGDGKPKVWALDTADRMV